MVWLRVLSRTNPRPGSIPNSFRFRTSMTPRILHHFGANKPFRIRTYRHASCNSFRIRTYKNTGGVSASSVPHCVSATNPLFSSICSLFVHLLPLPSFVFSSLEPLFAKHPGGGYPTPPPGASFPPSHAPRTSIPCALTRLRILPVTTGVSLDSQRSNVSAFKSSSTGFGNSGRVGFPAQRCWQAR